MKKIKEFLSKFRNPKTKKIHDDSSYIHSKFIYYNNSKFSNNIMILLEFSQDYFYDIMEITSTGALKTKLVNTSYDTVLDEVDEDGYNKILSIQKYYLLIGGSYNDYINLYSTIETMSNEALSLITLELYNNVFPDRFKPLIDDGILDNNKFTDKTLLSDELSLVNNDYIFIYDDCEKILNNLPSAFTGENLLSFIHISIINKHDGNNTIYSGYDFLKIDTFADTLYENIYKGIIKNPSYDKLKILTTPLYKREPFDEILNGSIDDVEIDDLFKQEYDRFNGIKSDTINYVDIDEILSEDTISYEDVVNEIRNNRSI